MFIFSKIHEQKSDTATNPFKATRSRAIQKVIISTSDIVGEKELLKIF